ncbi:MAG: Hsp20/alpha crystallin family protein [Deltaproteobacteria bacterium]|nr:Hsp20/alpha crystallin family protein [Deltaproteobacteria bacterium]
MLTRWSDVDRAFLMMDELQRRMSRIFEEYDGERWPGSARLTTGTWPLVNLYDAGDDLVITAQVPGLSEKDIQLTANQDQLTLSGERKVAAPEGYSAHRQERGSVKFSRSFTFPCKVNPEKTAATVKDGLLTVKLAKAAEAKPRQISVKAA